MILIVLVFLLNAKLTGLASETNTYTKPVVNQRQENCKTNCVRCAYSFLQNCSGRLKAGSTNHAGG